MRHQTAHALIEMLVALVIVALLAMAALPAYQDMVVRARRTEAQGALQALMQQQERYYSQFNSYIAFSAAASKPEARQFRWWTGRSASKSAYEVEGKPCTGADIRECIQLIATPGTARVDPRFKDPQCEQLILTSTGQRTASGPALRCWR
jgi:type IV pilus assembly protein PilE